MTGGQVRLDQDQIVSDLPDAGPGDAVAAAPEDGIPPPRPRHIDRADTPVVHVDLQIAHEPEPASVADVDDFLALVIRKSAYSHSFPSLRQLMHCPPRSIPAPASALAVSA